ncbi:MAG: DUF4160 domain-containing protein [Candidatus Omnitrophica bacterium]|nr:DUF4160 domain-containing protein [Candidatus Omnitrophota bacterium]
MPTVARIGGYRFFFFSNEGHEPPHIHVEAAEKYAKFWLEPVQLAQSVGYHAVELTRLRKLVMEHRTRFKERWHEHFGR